MTSLPVDPFPDIVGYNPAKVGGPVGHNLAYGPWQNMHEWFLKTSPTQTEATKGGELVFGAEQEAGLRRLDGFVRRRVVGHLGAWPPTPCLGRSTSPSTATSPASF